MDLLFQAIFVAAVLGLIVWFQHMIKKEFGITELSWKMTIITWLAAIGVPTALIGLLSSILKILMWMFV